MTFTPGIMTITSISRSLPAIVTVIPATTLTTGQVVRLVIPPSYGMQQLANKIVQISVISPTIFSLQYTQSPFHDVDSRDFDPFIDLGTGTRAQANCIGQGATPVEAPYPYLTNSVAVSKPNNPLLNNSTVEIPF